MPSPALPEAVDAFSDRFTVASNAKEEEEGALEEEEEEEESALPFLPTVSPVTKFEAAVPAVALAALVAVAVL